MTTITAYGGSDTIYIEQVGTSYFYSINTGARNLITSFPITVVNPNEYSFLPIIFKTNLTISNADFYFICGSFYLQFGSRDRNEDGSRATITISGVANYPGFIQNGTATAPAYSNIYIYNIVIKSISSALATSGVIGGGWLCQAYYGKGANTNRINNCASYGAIPANCGGIVGSNACTGGVAALTIVACGSTGSITSYAGGIVGRGCATSPSNNLTIEYCWSSGAITDNSGGITGYNCGVTGGAVTCTNCYSTGAITNDSGGIFGSDNGVNGGYITIEKSYSRGSIGVNCGGIYGINAGATNGFAVTSNCYSSGAIASTAGGIYGAGSIRSQINTTNCYTSGIISGATPPPTPNGGIYAGDSYIGETNYAEGAVTNTGWKDINASATLIDAPTPGSTFAFYWCQVNGLNNPYVLKDMGYTPYVQYLDIFASSSVIAGQRSPVAFVPGYTYSILVISGSASGITINTTSGSMTIASSVAAGIYNIAIYSSNDSYSITFYTLTVVAPTTSTTYLLQIRLSSTLIFNGSVVVDSTNAAPNIVGFYENGNAANLLAPPGSYGKNDNRFGSLSNPFDSYGVNITTMSYYTPNYGSNTIDNTYNLKNFSNGTGTILNFSTNNYTYTITKVLQPTTIFANGETDTIYIEQVGDLYYAIINDGTPFNIIGFPITIKNTSTTDVLPIIFRTNLTITNATFYFICGSQYLQFGRTDRNDDGSRPIITVSGITNYPGFIQNGTATTPAYSNTSIYNLIINSSASTLITRGGWLCQSYYGKAASGNTITNCATNGAISSYSGGIVGSYSCTGGTSALNSSLIIAGCSSTGAITSYAGGIVAANCAISSGAGPSGTDRIQIISCWSSGAISNYSGGMTGYFCGANGGAISCNNCYSTGAITDNSGGIMGSTNGFNGFSSVLNSYSRGSIGVNCGGIYGINAAQGGGSGSTTNSYSTGAIDPTGGGIYGVGYAVNIAVASYCYTSGTMTPLNDGKGGIYAGSKDIGGFTNYAEGVNANNGWFYFNTISRLYAVAPSFGDPPDPIIWYRLGFTIPFILNSMGYTPYVQPLTYTASSSVIAGQRSRVALVPGYTYSIINTNNRLPRIPGFTINATTGSITVATSVPAGTYTIVVYSINDSYSVTQYVLTVVQGGPRITFCITISLDNTRIFNGTFLVATQSEDAPNIVEFYEDGNPNNLLAPPGSYGNNDNMYIQIENPFDSYGVNITTMSYYATPPPPNYGSNNIPAPNGDATYNLYDFINGIGKIRNFNENVYTYTIVECPTPAPVPEPPVVYCPPPLQCRFCYSYKPPGLIEPTCIPVVCAPDQFLSTISLLPEVTNNSTRTTESALLQAMIKKQQQCNEQDTTKSTIQSTIANAAAINETVFSELINLKNQRYAPYQPYIYPVVPPSVMELQMRTVNVGVGVTPNTIMTCKGSQFVTT